jgi:hypothetical protein
MRVAQAMVEGRIERLVTLTSDGLIRRANRSAAEMIRARRDRIIGRASGPAFFKTFDATFNGARSSPRAS